MPGAIASEYSPIVVTFEGPLVAVRSLAVVSVLEGVKGALDSKKVSNM